ncbi:hypothetical protein V1508DRAFT_408547 [Lipomyces doorenjongii]|uniref:uncharacterized protein n=1 Tax=Lipomyces doorenjongii TaxID=383834 RepID=UPI0034CDC77D
MILRSNVLSGFVLILLASSSGAVEVDLGDLTASAYLAKADALLTQGNFQDALQFYDAAVKYDPQNYLSVFKRGATYLSIGRLNSAVADFDQVLEMKPDFDSALVQRGKLRLKMGNWDGARKDFKTATGNQKENIESVFAAENEVKAALKAKEAGKLDECIAHSSSAISSASAVTSLRSLRAECRLAKGLIREAVADLSHLANANPLSPEPHVRIARLQYLYLNDRDRAIQQLAKCLRYDPDAKACKTAFREYKRLDREIVKANELREKHIWVALEKTIVSGGADREGLLKKIEEMIANVDKEEKIPPSTAKDLEVELLEATCEAYLDLKRWGPGITYCARTLDYRPESIVALLFTARVHINNDEFDKAIEVLNKAKEASGGQNQQVNSMLNEAHVLLKRAKSKDYYKVLGVGRDATDKDIKKAYRSKTKEFHPDKYRGDLKLDLVEKKMAEINEAYEVLSNPELRERFDSGDDPNDRSQPGGGAGGFNPFFQPGFGGFGGAQQQFFQQGGRTFYRQSSGPRQHAGGHNFKFHF